MPATAIREHMEHPEYPLEHLSDNSDYICGGCDTPGFGLRHRCTACNLDLHEYCSYCPNNLSSFMHPHDLLLVTADPSQTPPTCDVCLDPLTGFYYMCEICQFDVHPLCTQLPEELRHAADDLHPLSLRRLPPSSGYCAVCGTECSLWCYGCDVCGVDIHPQCLLKPYFSPENSTSRGIPFPPPPAPASYSDGGFYYGPYSAYNYGGPYFGVGSGYGVGNYNYVHPYPYGYYSGSPYHINQQSVGGGGSSSSSGSGSGSGWGRLGKCMFALVGNLTSGVISNIVLGSLGVPSFF